ncbi:TonB-dependent receptor [Tardibacter chloracetimidivorans]|uniref:TonB-dependent receptor n=1 Tax=Tardibacter chloracetimidivorans TaxID=1921510 RepID=A0A1L3ZQU1_9SPHN|nr:TonB-dependent siderophore receptor [Tardibacter chloracetimidivorans]API57996.1 TonB-dependent receptor [Tardibacter chloracetimidivorans]
MTSIFNRLMIGASLAAIALPAHARDSAEDIIVTAQKQNQTAVLRGGSVGVFGDKAAEDTPFSIKTYNEALILNQQPQTLGQVLENDPSVRTTLGFGIAGELFVIRGFALSGDDVGFGGLYGIAPRQLVAPELAQSVQVLNGASAFINGAAPGGTGIGGSVNLMPKRADSQDLNRLTVSYTGPEHVGGAFDVSRRFGTNGEWGVRINGTARQGDVAIDDEFRSSYVLGGAFDYNSGPLRLALDVVYQRVKVRHQRPKLVIGDAIPAVPGASTNYGQPWQYTTLRDIFGQFRAEYDITDNAMIYAAFGARDGSERGFYQTIRLTDAVTGTATAQGSYIPRTDNNEAATAGMRVKLASSIWTHEINFGGSINWLVNRNAYQFYAASTMLTNIYDPVAVPRPDIGTFAGGDIDDPFPITRQKLSSLFVSDTIGFWNDRVLITGGIRLQEIGSKSYAANATGAIPAGGLTGKYSKDAVTPVFGLVVKPAQGVSLYANRVEGLVPGATAAATANAGNGVLPVSNAGQVLSPFVSTQYEFGGKLSLGKLNAGLAFFQIDRDIAIYTPDGGRSGFLVYGPFGVQRHRGIELSVDAEPVDGLRIIAGGSIIHAKLRKTQGGVNQGNKPTGVPEYMLNANVEWDVPFLRALTLTGRVVNTGKQAANLTNTLFLPSWTRLDLGVRYVAVVGDRPLTLRAGVDNVANKRYWASAFDSFRPDLQQGAPRTFKASASIDF